jgi:hypothetical protein
VRWDGFDADGIDIEGLRVPRVPGTTEKLGTTSLLECNMKMMRVTLHQLAPDSYFGQWLQESKRQSSAISRAIAQLRSWARAVIHSLSAASGVVYETLA